VGRRTGDKMSAAVKKDINRKEAKWAGLGVDM
jgi:hypothetical protein